MTEGVSPSHPGTYVKESIIPKGVSVKKAAEMMGIGRPALSNFLNGKASLSQNMATRLEKAFGAKKEELVALQQEYDSFINREEEKRIAVKSYTPSFLKITASHIETWAGKIEARSLLPVLLRRLVNSTGGEIVAYNFPAYDKSQTHGWDGTVESNNVTPWIPSGLSGWEFGCDQEPRTKANDDFNTRTKAISESERKNITFVFVTPRSWVKKNDWIKEFKAKNEWKDVRAFDAGDIEQWLEISVSAQVWMAEQLGLPTSHSQSLNSYWLSWSQTADPAISPKIFNSAISDHGKKIKDWYQSNPENPLIITAASKEEAKAFLFCIVEKEDELQPLLDQAVFVSSPETLKRLSGVSTDFIPVVDTDVAQKELVASLGKRRSIIISERNIKAVQPDISLDLPNFESFNEALNDMGFDRAQIDVYSNQSGHSPTILRRSLAKVPALSRPEWATSTERLRTMIPLVLAGSWNTSKSADKEILSCLAHKDYTDIEKDIADLVSLDDSPIWSEGKYRGVISELECFHAISDQLTEKDITNFFDLSEYVLSEDDPALDLDKKDRWAANIYNKVRDHSSAIRQNICQNLIILSVHGNALFGQRLGLNIESRVSLLISSLLKNKDSRVWQAQQSALPQYAEAAPEMFLSILEEELKRDVPAFRVLFEPVDSGFFARCERTGMLWALELLAWNPSLLARVVRVLGELSTYDLEDNWANKPINSLVDLLLIWRPHTAASVEQRCEILEMLCSQYPEIGWKLSIKPFMPGGDFTSGTYRPSWRSDASGAGNTVTRVEMRTYALKCIDLVLSWPSHSVKTLKDMVDCLPSMEDKDKKKVIDQVKAWVESSPDDEDVIELREHVRTRTMTTRAIRRNKKKNNNDNYVCGKELYDLLEPKDILSKHRWLFAKRWVEYTPEELEVDDFDHDAREKGLAKQRVNALNEIFSKYGIQGLIDLIRKSGSSFQIGVHLHNDVLKKDELTEFILSGLKVNWDNSYEFDNCISGILIQMSEEEREQFITNLIRQLPSEQDKEDIILKIFLSSPFCRNTWNQLEKWSAAVQRDYWKRILPGWRDLSSIDFNFAVDKLLNAERPFAAFNMVHFDFEKIESKCIVLLLKAIASNTSEKENYYKPSQHNIEQALETLNKRDDFDRMELTKLEYLYVDILHSHSNYGIPNLAKEVSKSPLFFMQLVAYSFKRSGSGSDPDEWNMPQDEESKRITGTKAYHVLDCLNVIPGTNKDGSIDARELHEWILQVRKLAKEHGRENVTDQMIGKLLSTSSQGEDGIWPREEIRKVFEAIGSTEISIGMEIGFYNSAGAEFREVDSSRERSRAQKYREMANKVMNKTPFVGKMLNNVADKYERDAEWWDADRRVNKRLGRW